MFKKATCPKCGRELTGAIETATTNDGRYVYIVQSETSDCNWATCTGCKQVTCKQCRHAQYRFCCYEGRIIETERARAAHANGGNNNIEGGN